MCDVCYVTRTSASDDLNVDIFEMFDALEYTHSRFECRTSLEVNIRTVTVAYIQATK